MNNSRTRRAAMMLLTTAAMTMAAMAGSVAYATPANAATPITVKMNGGVMSVVGTSVADAITVTQNGNGNAADIEVSDAQISAGPGCTPVGLTGRKARCSQVFQLSASGGLGDDSIDANIDSPAFLVAGSGRDTLIGGRGNDELRGGDGDDIDLNGRAGSDKIDGGNGVDDCVKASVLTRCEL